MEKKYVTARLFRNRETDCCQDSDEKCQDTDQQPTTNACCHDPRENHDAVESSEVPCILSLPERIFCTVKKLLALILS